MPPGWKLRRLQGSYNDIPFFVDGIDRDAGRRQAIHEYPGRKEVFVEDLGEDSDRFTVNAYVIGPDYDLLREQLERELLREGEGFLVHPYRGAMTVNVVGRISTTESKDNGGRADIRFDVVVSVPVLPITDDALADKIRDAADASEELSQQAFEDAFDASTLEEDHKLSAIEAIQAASAKLEKLQAKVAASIGTVGRYANSIVDLADNATTLIAAPTSLALSVSQAIGIALSSLDALNEQVEFQIGLASSSARNPALGTASSLRNSINESVENTLTTFGRGSVVRALLDQVFDLIDTFGNDFDPIAPGTKKTDIEKANRDSIIHLVKVGVLYETARRVSELPFESRAQALDARKRFVLAFDQVYPSASPKEYDALRDVHAALGEHLRAVAKTLPQVATYTPKIEMPALLIAQIIYGDATKSTDIIERNGIKNPNFVTAGESLEIISVT